MIVLPNSYILVDKRQEPRFLYTNLYIVVLTMRVCMPLIESNRYRTKEWQRHKDGGKEGGGTKSAIEYCSDCETFGKRLEHSPKTRIGQRQTSGDRTMGANNEE